MAQPRLEAIPEGTLFCARYRVIRVIDAGGMGVVYEVVDERTKRRRALKTIHSSLAASPEIRARFALEATATAGVRSDHLVEVLDSGLDEASGMPYLVMELLEGENLAALLSRQGPCKPEFVIDCLQQVAWALDKLHEAGVVHRDLKPENVILAVRDDGSPKAKIIDFGIVKVVAQGSVAQTTRNTGTPFYMSPEQIRGDGSIGKAADLYALGHIAFTLLTGRAYWEVEPCYQQGPVPLLARILHGGNRERATARAQRSDASLPAAFDAWFDRATADAPMRRHSSATELVQELASVLGVPLPKGSSRDREAAGKRRRHTRRRLMLAISVVTILLLTLTVVVSQSRRVVSTEVLPASSATVHRDLFAQPAAIVSATASVVAAVVPSSHSSQGASLTTQRTRAKPLRIRAPIRTGDHPALELSVRPKYDPTDER